MSTYKEIESAIVTRMQDRFTTVPVWYENVRYTRPATAHVKFFVHCLEELQAGVGGAVVYYRTPGLITAQVFVPHGQGKGLALDLGGQIAGIFRNALFSGIICRAARVFAAGEDGDFYQVNVTVQFEWDSVHPMQN